MTDFLSVFTNYCIFMIFFGGVVYSVFDREAANKWERWAFAFYWPMHVGYLLALTASIWRVQVLAKKEQILKERQDGTL